MNKIKAVFLIEISIWKVYELKAEIRRGTERTMNREDVRFSREGVNCGRSKKQTLMYIMVRLGKRIITIEQNAKSNTNLYMIEDTRKVVFFRGSKNSLKS